MKLIALIKKINPIKSEFKHSIDIESLCEDLNISIEDTNNISDSYWTKENNGESLLSACSIARHYCTDTIVGNSVLFFKNEPVAFISQTGRKMSPGYKWLSLYKARSVKDYLLSLVEKQDLSESIELLNSEFEVNDLGYMLYFSEQLLEKKVYYNNELCEVLEINPTKDLAGEKLIIRVGDEKKEVLMKDCIVPYNLTEES